MRHDVPMLAAEELSAVVVEAHAVLAFAGLDGQPHRSRIKRKIASESHRFCSRLVWIRYVTGVAIDQPVNAVVQSPGQTSEDAFGIKCPGAISPTGENYFFFICHAVIIGVFEIKQVRR